MNQHLRSDVEWAQAHHPEFGHLYSLLHDVKATIIDLCFHDWRDRFSAEDLPLVSLEAMPPSHDAGQWRGKFMEIGPLGFANVISLNMMKFDRADAIPKVLAHEICHWWDRPNTGHGSTFWDIMERRCGLRRHDMYDMTWVRICERLPFDDLAQISLWPGARNSQDVVD